ncbi:MAG TPA: DUF4139 domain-containing protein [Blastocatellia bacterium]|nr:DUF4139 domain-containing protein [Blastocatellia bacterium]
MKSNIMKIVITFIAILGLLLPTGALGQQRAQSIESTIADQRSIAITIYNSNLGLVRDTRQVNFPTGDFRVRFMDVAAQINPATVHIESLTNPGNLSVLEQNYEYDLLNPQKLLDKYVGKTVTLVLKRLENGTEKLEPKQATLLANNDGQQVWQIEGQIVINPTNIASINFPNLPETLIAHPTLTWDLLNKTSGPQTIEASYLTGGINWNADYVVVLNKDEKLADLNGWVTINNNSGGEYRDAQLQLVAGTVNRVQPPQYPSGVAGGRAMKEETRQFQEEGLLEYHLYTLDRKTTIRNNETKQISLLSGSGIGVTKEYTLLGQRYFYQGYNSPGQPVKQPVGVYVSFENSEKNKLGMPLPEGTIRVYKADSKGGQQFVGEDHIDHTPKDETVRVKLGEAFDIVAERIQKDYKVLASNLHEYEYEITIRNHKNEPITVVVNEPIGGDWEMVQSTIPATKTSAFSARFEVPVTANGQTKLDYRVRVKY